MAISSQSTQNYYSNKARGFFLLWHHISSDCKSTVNFITTTFFSIMTNDRDVTAELLMGEEFFFALPTRKIHHLLDFSS